MNHCLIQAVINSAPQMRYTKENQTAIAEMIVNFKGLRSEDPTRDLKIIGWGNIAQEMVDELKEGQNIVIEGRLKMNSITRKDGTKEKQPELTASKIHQISPVNGFNSDQKEKLNIQVEDFFKNETYAETKFIKENSNMNLKIDINYYLDFVDQVRKSVRKIDENLVSFLNSIEKKQIKDLNTLEKKIIKSQKIIHQSEIKKISTIRNKIFFNG